MLHYKRREERKIILMEENRRKGVAKGVIQRKGKGNWLTIDSGFSCIAKGREVCALFLLSLGILVSSGKHVNTFLSMDGDNFFFIWVFYVIILGILLHDVEKKITLFLNYG